MKTLPAFAKRDTMRLYVNRTNLLAGKQLLKQTRSKGEEGWQAVLSNQWEQLKAPALASPLKCSIAFNENGKAVKVLHKRSKAHFKML